MEIRIDTKKDSVEDIKKTIDFLLKFAEHGNTSDVPTVGDGSFNLFNDTTDSDSSKDKDDDDPVSIVEY